MANEISKLSKIERQIKNPDTQPEQRIKIDLILKAEQQKFREARKKFKDEATFKEQDEELLDADLVITDWRFENQESLAEWIKKNIKRGQPSKKSRSTTRLNEVGISFDASSFAQLVLNNKELKDKLIEESKKKRKPLTFEQFKKAVRKQTRQEKRKQQPIPIQTANNIIQADVLNYKFTEDYHFLITDPPYGILNEQWEPKDLQQFTYEWLNYVAPHILNGCLIFWSQRFLWDGRTWFDKIFSEFDFKFQHLLIWHYPNNKSPQNRMGFKQTWEPIFFYRKINSDFKIEISESTWGNGINDFDCHVAAVPQSNFNGFEEKVHPAQKPLSVLRWLVSATTQPNNKIFDCFAGSGTTGIACKQLDREFLGLEKEMEFVQIGNKRIMEATRI